MYKVNVRLIWGSKNKNPTTLSNSSQYFSTLSQHPTPTTQAHTHEAVT